MNDATAHPALEFNFTAAPSTRAAPLAVTGTATFDDTPDVKVFLVYVNVPAGTYPLMVVGGTAPTTSVPALTIMGGYSGSTLSWSGNTLMLNISGTAGVITWNSGVLGIGFWDVNNLANLAWMADGAVSTYYQEITGTTGDQVLFADTYITANTAVLLNTAVSPTSVWANNEIYTYTLSGSSINGTTRLTKSGGAPLVLNMNNNYSGGTTIVGGGILTVGWGGALGGGSVTNDGILNITANNTGITLNVLAGAGTNNVVLSTGGNQTTLNGNYSAFTGLWNVGFNAGGGKVQMNGLDNSAATINILTNATIYCTTGTHNAKLILNGGNTGESYGQLRLDNASWAGPITLMGPITDGADAFFGNDAASTISGVIDDLGNGVTVDKLRPGTLTFSGANTYRGPTWVKDGALSVPSINNVNAGAGPLGFPLNSAQGTVKLGFATTTATLIYTGTGNTSDRIIDMAGTTVGATLNHSGSGLLKMTGYIVSSGAGAKTLTLQGASPVSTGEVAGVISDSPNGAVSVTKAGGAVWRLSGNSTFSGNVTVSTSILVVASSGSLGVGNKTVVVNNGNNAPQLHLDGSAGPITLGPNISFQTSNGQGPLNTQGAIHNIAGTNTIEGNITLTSGNGGTAIYSWADKLFMRGAKLAGMAPVIAVCVVRLG
jgi:autotransporter-associated beta strand protein